LRKKNSGKLTAPSWCWAKAQITCKGCCRRCHTQ